MNIQFKTIKVKNEYNDEIVTRIKNIENFEEKNEKNQNNKIQNINQTEEYQDKGNKNEKKEESQKNEQIKNEIDNKDLIKEENKQEKELIEEKKENKKEEDIKKDDDKEEKKEENKDLIKEKKDEKENLNKNEEKKEENEIKDRKEPKKGNEKEEINNQKKEQDDKIINEDNNKKELNEEKKIFKEDDNKPKEKQNEQTEKKKENSEVQIPNELIQQNQINQIRQKEEFIEIDFPTFIYKYLLFLKCDERPLFHSLPKCNYLSSSIKFAYHLLVLLSFKDTEKRQTIINQLYSFHSLHFWKSGQISSWKISLKDSFKTQPYVGIRNLGCTCYMNSLFQIFYHIPQFRESIMKCECPVERKNVLYQLKKVFFNLKYFESKFCDAIDFCRNFDDRMLNTSEQMDIDEFFIVLLDKIENHLQKTTNSDLVKYFFEGKNSDELIFQNSCSHHKQNEINFYSIQLQVKNKKSLNESLDSIIEGELMDGDNKIVCATCNEKHPAIKRQSFKVLPRMLIFVLKRFEFNYDTMTKTKLNDYYEFPHDLDMTKFTTEYLHNKTEGKSDTNVDNQYRLKGIVIHTGHSEGGHYYAYIRDGETNEWYEFNDIKVEKFDISKLKEEAFGGVEIKVDPKTNKKEKIEISKNAYLLFYEKVNNNGCVKFDKINFEQNMFDNFEIIEQINHKMYQYHIQNTIFSDEYHLFVLELVINLINIPFKPKEFLVFANYLSKNRDDAVIDKDIANFRDIPPVGSNISYYIQSKIIHLIGDNNAEKKENIAFVLDTFKFLIVYFFNVLLHSKNSTYFGGTVDLIKFCMNKYKECAAYLLEEFSNLDIIFEYLVFCPLFEKKKIMSTMIESLIILVTSFVIRKT